MSQAVQDLFARIAGRYDLLNRVLTARRDLAWRRAAVRLLPSQQGCLLDLAAGTHDLGLAAVAAGKAGTIIGADFCVPMLIAGQEKIAGHPIAPVGADAQALPFADSSFDGAVMAYGLRNLDNPSLGLRELFRVLRPGAPLLILEFFRPHSWWTRFFYGPLAQAILPSVGALVAKDRAAYQYLRNSIRGFMSPHECDDLLRRLGFTATQWRPFWGGVCHAVCARRAEQAPLDLGSHPVTLPVC